MSRRLVSVLLVSLLAACAAPAATAPDIGPRVDGGGTGDAGFDASFPDAGEVDASVPDAGEFADGGDENDGGSSIPECHDPFGSLPAACEYIDLDRLIVYCGGERKWLVGWATTTPDVEGCTGYWTVDGWRCDDPLAT